MPNKAISAFGTALIALEATLLNHTAQEVLRGHNGVALTIEEFLEVANGGAYYCANGGYTRIGFNKERGELFLVETNEVIAKRWKHDQMVWAFRTALQELLASEVPQ